MGRKCQRHVDGTERVVEDDLDHGRPKGRMIAHSTSWKLEGPVKCVTRAHRSELRVQRTSSKTCPLRCVFDAVSLLVYLFACSWLLFES